MDPSTDQANRQIHKTETAHAEDFVTPTAIGINEAGLNPEEVHKIELASKRVHVNAGHPSPLELA